ncbi:FixH family protein [Halocynthiibacter namhaensis]|uniref:FixH family protein n=1 Tax=Halocynthiibacter namhaensis TaxID=1290553 RepID=UPI00068AD95E|nr:FixH family protein [Halocynthiibacter namhaensis]
MNTPHEDTGWKLNGYHVFGLFAAGFAVIITVNLFLAYSAVRTFPGLEVKNSYIASQDFDVNRARQQALGWQVEGSIEDGILRVEIRDVNGAPLEVAQLDAIVARRTHVRDDFTPNFVFDGTDYVANVDMASGSWQLRLLLRAPDGTEFQQRHNLCVDDPECKAND